MREAEPTLSLRIRNLSQELDLTPLSEELGSKSLKGRDGESEKISINKSKTQTYPVPKNGSAKKVYRRAKGSCVYAACGSTDKHQQGA